MQGSLHMYVVVLILDDSAPGAFGMAEYCIVSGISCANQKCTVCRTTSTVLVHGNLAN